MDGSSGSSAQSVKDTSKNIEKSKIYLFAYGMKDCLLWVLLIYLAN